jgi:hypothetical protein
MKKIIVLTCVLLNISLNNANAADPCLSKACGDASDVVGMAVGSLLGLATPHLFPNLHPTPYGRRFTFGLGNENLKEANLELNSNIRNSNALIASNFNIQLYGSELPAFIRFGLGGGYLFDVNQDTSLIASIKLSLRKIENVSTLELGPETYVNLRHILNDKLALDIEGRATLYDSLLWKVSAGVEYNAYSTSFLFMLGLQDNAYFSKKIYSADFGFKF